jgi:hypothetical protein
MSLQSNTNNDIFIVPSQSLMQFSGSNGNTITLQVEPSGAVNFVGTTGSILKIMDNLSGSLFSVNNISGLSILEVFSNNQVKIGNPANYALVISGSNVIITGSLVDKSTGVKFLVVDTATGVVHTTGSGGGGGSSTTPGGSPTQIQYNSASAFGGVPTLTYDGTTLRATGSFTGSLTGSLFGTASWAQTASQAITASYISMSSTNTGTLTISYAVPGVIQLTAITSSNNAQGTSNQLQYSAGGGTFGAVASSSYNNGTNQLTLGNIIATGSFSGSLNGTAATASFTPNALITASVVSNVITFTKGNGTTFPITVNTGSGGSAFPYTGSAVITGSLVVTGSTTSTLGFTGSLFGTSSWAQTSSQAITASYVNLVAGPRIQAINYSGSVISITGSIGGSDTQIQFNSGSAFSGSNNFIFDYTNSTARLTGSLLITGSNTTTGSFNVYNSGDTFFTPKIVHDRLTTGGATNPYMSLSLVDGLGVSGSVLELQVLSKGTTVNTYFAGGINIAAYPQPGTTTSGRPIKFINSILDTPDASSFEWHYRDTVAISNATKKMTLDVPSGILSNSGSITTSGSLTIASGSTNTNGDSALYFGSSGSVGSWRIAPSGSNLVIQKWNGTSYTQSGIFS